MRVVGRAVQRTNTQRTLEACRLPIFVPNLLRQDVVIGKTLGENGANTADRIPDRLR